MGRLLRLLPLLPGRAARRLRDRLSWLRIPLLHRLIKYPSFAPLLRGAEPGPLYFDPARRAQICDVWRDAFGSPDSLVAAADRICEHVFDLLGSGPTPVGETIDWHADFKSRGRWPAHRPLARREIVDLGRRRDIKVPWELSRFQHASILGRAYWLSGDEKYAVEFARQIRSWLKANPWGRGPNWACAMEVAIRAANWALAYGFFGYSPSLDERMREQLFRSLWEHGCYIAHNLERGRVNGNHYIADLAGLFVVGVFFGGCGARWRDFALRELFSQMRSQVLADGVDYEKSTAYHRLVLELFTCSFILAQRCGLKIPDDVAARWEKMFEFAAAYTKPDGTVAQIGDADDGLFYRLGSPAIDFRDHRYLLSIGAVLFDRPDLARAADGWSEEALWLLGPKSRARFAELGRQPAPPAGCAAFPDSGFYIVRSGDNWAIIDAGDNGMSGVGAHAHNDTLSFELCVGGVSFVVDPGAYVYTADAHWRNRFRSTAYHNTVMIDRQEIHPINEQWLFALPDAGRVRVIRWEPDGDVIVFEGEHDAYARLKQPVVHRRRIEFHVGSRTWLVEDAFEGTGSHWFESRLHFAPGANIQPSGTSMPDARSSGIAIPDARSQGSSPHRAQFHAELPGTRLEVTAGSEVEFGAAVEDGWYSPSYGVKTPIKVLVFSWEAATPCRLALQMRASRLT